MTQSLLVTTIIIMIEILLVLLALFYLGFRRYQKLKTQKNEKLVVEKQVDSKVADDVMLSEYLNQEIERTTQRLKLVEQSPEHEIPVKPLKRRLELLLAEREVNERAFKPENKNKCWNIINTYYEDNTSPTEVPDTEVIVEPEGEDDSQMEELMDKIHKLEKFEDQYNEVEKKLQDANNTIEILKAAEAQDENEDQPNKEDQAEIKKLKQEIEALQNQLATSDQVKNTDKVEDIKLQNELNAKHEELKVYDRLVNQANDKLKSSSETIDDLNRMINKNDSSNELKKMQRMIAQLTNDNSELKKKMEVTKRPDGNLMQVQKAAEKQALQEELGMYMDLFMQANEKLKESNITIEEFRKIIESSEESEELKQIEAMVEKLVEDNNELQLQLHSQMNIEQDDGDVEQEVIAKEVDNENEELEIYKNLVNQANEKLKESNKTIDELKKLIDESAPSEELDQMKKMIEKLSEDNVSLLGQINDLKETSKEKLEAIKKDSELQKKTLHDEIIMYKDLVCQANDKLKESNQTIEGLKIIVNNSVKSDETEQMEAMLDKLSEDNIQMGKKLETVNEQLQESLNKFETIKLQDEELKKELEVIKEEKWFLEQQIKHLQSKHEENT